MVSLCCAREAGLDRYADTLNWIMSFWDPGRPKDRARAARALKVVRMRALLDRLGSPQTLYPSVLVAGTKGKGSTCAFIAEGLRAAGYLVGRYTQPHLIDWRERTWVDGRLIEPDEVVSVGNRVRAAVEGLAADGAADGITTYEVGTALTLAYFASRRVEVAVLEIGIGGELDALNVVDPVLSVITSISFDHTDVLGDTLAEIAHEKAGIMRAGVPVVSSPQRPEAEATIMAAAEQVGAPLSLVGRDWRWVPGEALGTIDVEGPAVGLAGVPVPLPGDHQRENATAAIAALRLLEGSGFSVGDDAIRRGFAAVNWPGRIQRLREKPIIVADAAHNADSVERLLETVEREFRYRRMIVVFGASAEKDVAGMARSLGPRAAEVLITSSGHRRAAGTEGLAEAFRTYAPVSVAPDPADAFGRALAAAEAGDLVLITGSVFLAGRAIEFFA